MLWLLELEDLDSSSALAFEPPCPPQRGLGVGPSSVLHCDRQLAGVEGSCGEQVSPSSDEVLVFSGLCV